MSDDSDSDQVLLDTDGNGSTTATRDRDPAGYYAALGLRETASPREVRRAFLALSQRYHSDKHVDQSEEVQQRMNERFQLLQDAYAVLSDERQRAAYDASGEQGVERLALVPASVTRRADIAAYLNALEREAEVVRTAKMLSATSDIKVTYSTAKLFMPARRHRRRAAAQQQEPQQPHTEEESRPHTHHAHGAAAPPAGESAAKDTASTHSAGVPAGDSRKSEKSADHEHTDAASAAKTKLGAGITAGKTDEQRASGATRTEPATEAANEPGATHAATAPSPSSPADASSKAAGTPPASPNPAAALRGKQAQMMAKEIVINGKPTIVLIPGEDMQKTLRKSIEAAAAAAAASGGGAASGAQPAGAAASRGSGHDASSASAAPPAASSSQDGTVGNVVAVRGESNFTAYNAMVACVPKSVTFSHSFEHAVSPRTDITFQTDARSDAGHSSISFTTKLSHQHNPILLSALVLRSSISGLKVSAISERALTPLWSLRTRLTLLRDANLLDKLEMTLKRKLSPSALLESTLAWSLTEPGYFKSAVQWAARGRQQGLSAYISLHGLDLTAYSVEQVTYGVGYDSDDVAARASRNVPSPGSATKGKVQYSITCSPFTGQTHAGFEAWYLRTPRQHYGIAFMTIVPVSFCPFAPPLFFVTCERYAVVNEVSLLYARGQHRLRIPIIAFISPRVSAALVWVGLPLTLLRVGQTVYKPYARARAARHHLRERRQHVAEVDLARQTALLEQRAIEPAVRLLRAAEERKGGLVIISAVYGVLNPTFLEVPPPDGEDECGAGKKARRETLGEWCLRQSDSVRDVCRGVLDPVLRLASLCRARWTREAAAETKAGPVTVAVAPSGEDVLGADAIPLTLDVTVALQSLVRDSALSLPSGTKSRIAGFYDPDPHTPELKELRVEYWFNKKRHCVTVGDGEGLDLPSEHHLAA